MKKSIYLLFVLAITSAFTSCEVNIPEKDEKAPTYSFFVNDNDGFSKTFTNEHTNAILNARVAHSYSFLFTGSDSGGVKYASISMPLKDSLLFVVNDSIKWTAKDMGTKRVFEWNGDSSNPLSAAVAIGGFITAPDAFDFEFKVEDFGGEEGNVNTTTGQLKVKAAIENTETTCENCEDK